jgi:hypothetical protein
MVEISKLSRVIDGASRNISLSTNTLVVDNIKIKAGNGSNYFTFLGLLTGARYVIMPDADVNLGHINSLSTLSGVSAGDTNLGTFTGSIISDGVSIKDALQSLEDYVETNLGGISIDSSFRIADDLDNTKLIAFTADNISPGATRTITMPDEDVDLGLISTLSQDLADEIDTRETIDIDFESRISTLEFDPVTKTYVDNSIASFNGRLIALENIANRQLVKLYRNNSSVYTTGFRGNIDPSSSFRDGWYFKNTTLGDAINWQYYNDSASVAPLDGFSGYALMTFDSDLQLPIFTIDTLPTGSGDVDPAYHSRVVYSIPASATPVVGKKYLVYFGIEPTVYPSTPRIELTLNTALSAGDQGLTEIVFRSFFSSDVGAGADTVQWMVESLGISASNFKYEAALSIKEQDAKESFNITTTPQLTSINLSRDVVHSSVIVSIDRLLLHETDDYTLSDVDDGLGNIVTKLTWTGDIAVSGSSALAFGDNIKVKYRYNS